MHIPSQRRHMYIGIKSMVVFTKDYVELQIHVQTVPEFVCLHARSVRRHTWVLMGPDSNKCSSQAFKSL